MSSGDVRASVIREFRDFRAGDAGNRTSLCRLLRLSRSPQVEQAVAIRAARCGPSRAVNLRPQYGTGPSPRLPLLDRIVRNGQQLSMALAFAHARRGDSGVPGHKRPVLADLSKIGRAHV